MQEEIKEILFRLEIVARKHTIEICDDGNIETIPASVVDELSLNNYSAKILLDYITNLQEENEYFNHCDEEKIKTITNLRYKIERLELENERLKEELQQEKKDFKEVNDYCFELKDYKSRNEKAIEYIKRHIQPDSFEGYLDSYEIKKTLNILQGVDKE